MNAVDTNILIYAQDPRDPAKHQVAKTLVASLQDGALLWQVACEYIAASRKLATLGYNEAQAFQDLSDLQTIWQLQLPTWQMFQRTETLRQRYHLSFWDALIVSACLEAGVTRLYSEDFDTYKTIDGLQLVNPFKP